MTRTRIIGIGAAAAVLVVAAAAFGGWYFLLSDDPPLAVNLADAVSAVSSDGTSADGDATEEPAVSGTPDASTIVTPVAGGSGAAGGDAGGLVGVWAVSPGSDSFVGYRVAEELSTVGVATAVGRSSDLTAALSFDGAAITAVDVEANLAALTSDDNRRDRTLRKQAIETNSFPTASFALTEPIVLDAEPIEGVPIAVAAIGDLTLHGVTRSVTVDLEGQLVGDLVVIIGSTPIVFADYEIEQPRAIILLSVADEGVMEFQLVLERS